MAAKKSASEKAVLQEYISFLVQVTLQSIREISTATSDLRHLSSSFVSHLQQQTQLTSLMFS